jgi:hypothetical protein
MAKIREYKVYFSGKGTFKSKFGSVMVFANNATEAKKKGREKIMSQGVKSFDIEDVKFTKWVGSKD